VSANIYNGGIIGASATDFSGVWGVGDQGITYGAGFVVFEYLVVAGGGGGGAGDGGSAGGGGGAGGYRTSVVGQTSGANSTAEGTLGSGIGALLTVTVGAGGAGGGSTVDGANGSNSVFGSITSIGGGGGGKTQSAGVAGSGGSGGGRGWVNTAGPGTGTASQGFDGSNNQAGGVGGGGGGAGSLPTTAAGGNGLTSNITGSTSSSRSVGGASLVNGTPAANTGSGGNSQNSPRTGTAGGSGIVVIRYPDTFANLLINSGLTFRTSVGGSATGTGARETPSYTITNWKVYEFTAGTGTVEV
jgi:mucin-19